MKKALGASIDHLVEPPAEILHSCVILQFNQQMSALVQKV